MFQYKSKIVLGLLVMEQINFLSIWKARYKLAHHSLQKCGITIVADESDNHVPNIQTLPPAIDPRGHIGYRTKELIKYPTSKPVGSVVLCLGPCHVFKTLFLLGNYYGILKHYYSTSEPGPLPQPLADAASQDIDTSILTEATHRLSNLSQLLISCGCQMLN